MMRLFLEKHITVLGIILVTTACILPPCTAQTYIDKSTNMFRDGDKLTKQIIAYKEVMQQGAYAVWSIDGSPISDHTYNQQYIAPHGSDTGMICLENATRYSYDLCADTLFLGGFENNTTKISYNLKEPYFIFPMKYGDSFSGFFHGTGVYCDKIALRSFGKYHISADAYGSLVLPEGDTLKDAIRLHTVRFVSSICYPADSLSSISSSPLTTDSIRAHMEAEPYIMKSDIYRWYVKEFRYPVFETYTTTASGREETPYSRSFYYPPSWQRELVHDTDNEKRKCFPDTDEKPAVPQSGIPYYIQQTGRTSVRLEHTLPVAARVNCIVCTTDGKTVYRSVHDNQESGLHHEIIDLPVYKNCVYILKLCIGDEQHTEKIILRR